MTGELVGRDGGLATFGEALSSLAKGIGQRVVVLGAPGSGRTAFLGRAREMALDAGVRVVSANASFCQRTVRFGVLAQLVRELADHTDPVDESTAFTVVQRRLMPALRGGPLCVLVDDAQWVDRESKVWMDTVVRRLHSLPLLLVLGGGEPQGAIRITLPRLDVTQIGAVAESVLGEPVDADFAHAATLACEGLPGLLGAALQRLRRRRGGLTAADLVAQIGAVRGHHVSKLLSVLPAEAVALLRAIAVADGDLDLDLVCLLARPRTISRAELVAELAGTGLVEQLHGCPRLSDPIAATELLAGMTGHERAELYACAAGLAYQAGISEDGQARLLMGARPIGADWALRTLRSAAGAARSAALHVTAGRLLTRALAEVPERPVARAEVLAELAEAELNTAPEAGERRLAALLRTSTDPALGAIRVRAADLLVTRGNYGEARRAVSTAVLRGGAEHEQLAALYWLNESLHHGEPDSSRAVAELPDLPTDPSQAGVVAWRRAAGGRNAKVVRALARQALAAEPGSSPVAPRIAAAKALLLTDDIAEARAALNGVLHECRRRAVPVAVGLALVARADLALRCGDLRGAEQDLDAARAELYPDRLHPVAMPTYLASCMTLHLHLGRFDLAEELAATPLPAGVEHSFGWTHLLFLKGLLHLIRGELLPARHCFHECGRRLLANQWTNPALFSWRCMAAATHPEAAAELVEEELVLARAWGTPSAIGSTHLYAGMAQRQQAAGHFAEAVRLLRGTPLRLNHVTALIELAESHLGVQNWSECAAVLGEARELAVAQDWELVHARIAELGHRYDTARLRARLELSEVEAQVAQLAAGGMPNAEIAGVLSMGRRGVEESLASVYRKLGVPGRRELSTVLKKVP
ncbi:LuxR family transcriptional regulator [Kutzneria albida]|uniref:LuxR-family transcription regulator n=1 Tax=Kutzneria albida DSM 43870 TaxID=1449976 RepID=W5WP46_9PSEU|nr:LuxR family transcriptional regulator [Kutzneria albida]AHH99949.1 LuxR-family transcription regulator [Kutzneria albida DSM 43870]